MPQPSENKITLGYALFGLLALVGVIVALVADQAAVRFLLAGVALFMVLSLVFMTVLRRGQERGRIGYLDHGPLTFRPTTAFYGLQVTMAIVGVVTGLGTFLIDPFMLRQQGALFIGALAVGSLIWLITQLVSMRLPAGLRVAEEGLTGVRGVGRRTFSWEELLDATPEAVGNELALGLTETNGLVTSAGSATYLGSDPAVVAQIVLHFIDHPDDRHLLNDPAAAILRVEQAAAAQAQGQRVEKSPRPDGAGVDGEPAATSNSLHGGDATVTSNLSSNEGFQAHDGTDVKGPDKRPLLEWPPQRGWWWRWPLTLIVAICWALTFISLIVLRSNEQAWVALLFYAVLATAGTFVLQWHRRVRRLNQ